MRGRRRHDRPHGIFDSLICDRPTADAGRRCIGLGECETDCVWDRVELAEPEELDRLGFAPWCEHRERARIAVGHCHERTSPFACRPRIERPSAACDGDAPPVVPMSWVD